MEEIVSLSKRRGFVFPTSEIYGGLANSYNYGPLGAQLMKNIRDAWWKKFIVERDDMVGLDTQILLHPQTWVASGHVGTFSDPLVEDMVTRKRYRADHLIEAYLKRQGRSDVIVEDMDITAMDVFIKNEGIKSPDGNALSDCKTFNLLFETSIGTVVGEKAKVYMRGETAQGIFTDFKQVMDSTRVSLPFGIGNIGKSFRNEITTGQFVFRTLEFEQAEIEYFFNPEANDPKDVMELWKSALWHFLTKTIGLKEENLRWRKHTDKERSHYSLDTYDIEYNYPFGWKELWGLAYRTDYDLRQHMDFSGKNLRVVDPATGKQFIPHVIEPALGVNRLFLAILADAYRKDAEKERVVLELAPHLAPVQAAVIPLARNKKELVDKATELFHVLKKGGLRVAWDDRGNVGKAYLAQDEAGTPFCITIDFETLTDNAITVRDRNTTVQQRIPVAELLSFLSQKIGNTV